MKSLTLIRILNQFLSISLILFPFVTEKINSTIICKSGSFSVDINDYTDRKNTDRKYCLCDMIVKPVQLHHFLQMLALHWPADFKAWSILQQTGKSVVQAICSTGERFRVIWCKWVKGCFSIVLANLDLIHSGPQGTTESSTTRQKRKLKHIASAVGR